LSRHTGFAGQVVISHKQFHTFLSKRQEICHGLILEACAPGFFIPYRQVVPRK
jgi:hypothetical protein